MDKRSTSVTLTYHRVMCVWKSDKVLKSSNPWRVCWVKKLGESLKQTMKNVKSLQKWNASFKFINAYNFLKNLEFSWNILALTLERVILPGNVCV